MDVFRFGISLASLLPWSMRSWFWPFGSPLRAASWAADAGYDFLQALPLRGMTGGEFWPRYVLYKEGAWNPVNGLMQALLHLPGGEGMPSSLRDWIAFPRVGRCHDVANRLPGTRIRHEQLPYQLYEVNPDSGNTIEEIIQSCKQDRVSLVLDPEHLLRDSRQRPGWSPFGDTEDERFAAIEMLAPYVRVVHVKTTWDGPTGRVFRDLFGNDSAQDIDFVAEFTPSMSGPAMVRAHMKTFLGEMKAMVDFYQP